MRPPKIHVLVTMLATHFIFVLVIYIAATHRNSIIQQLRSNDQTSDSWDEFGNCINNDGPLLCLFTTFKPTAKKMPIYASTLRNWASVDNGTSRLELIVYDTSGVEIPSSNNTNSTFRSENMTELKQLARELGWHVLSAPRVSRLGIPFLKDMFRDTAERFTNCMFYGYSNGDILYSRRLVSTLEAVAKELNNLGPTMIVGRRTNVDMQIKFNVSKLSGNITSQSRVRNVTIRTIFHPDDVDRAAKKSGRLFWSSAEDYFLVTSGLFKGDNTSKRDEPDACGQVRPATAYFPWHRFADVVIGRSAYDNYLVAMAIKLNVSVIDATETVTALHQTDSEGNMAGHRVPDALVNRRAIGRGFNFFAGTTASTPFYTKVDRATGNVTVHRRPPKKPKKKKVPTATLR